ncbi:hypothetical protein C1280_10205 [Gemmata obscuriglobus]|uniref:Uncharacterized protein n=1 Tax=Gemmata obscuriglobus TaxID=114 RepID=A0A2Z3HCS3_9BACT|nr:hypothetical protein C1280_10205 [Gemmata obscuriglobus]
MVLRVVRVRAGAARRREVRWWVASGVPRHGAWGRWWLRSAAPVGGLRGCAAWGVCPGTADVSEPNPALHLTPPSDLGRTADPVMALQVSSLFGHPEALDHACGGGVRVVRGA